MLFQATEAYEKSFGISSEAFNPGDMALFRGKFVFTVLDAKVLLVPKVHKAIVTAPAVRVDHAFKVNVTANNPLEGCLEQSGTISTSTRPWRLKKPKTMGFPRALRPLTPRTRRAPK